MKAIIFDMDGVIIDSEPLYFDRHIRFLNHHKVELKQEDLHPMAGASGADSWAILQQIIGDEVEQEVYYQALSEFHQHTPIDYTEVIDPDIYTVLDYLTNENYRIGLASSSGIRTIEKVLQQGELTDYFDIIMSGEMFERSKPNPEIYLKTAEKLEVGTDNCLAIEDSTYGIQAAKAAGMYVLAKEDTRFNFEQHLADKKIKRLTEIIEFLG